LNTFNNNELQGQGWGFCLSPKIDIKKHTCTCTCTYMCMWHPVCERPRVECVYCSYGLVQVCRTGFCCGLASNNASYMCKSAVGSRASRPFIPILGTGGFTSCLTWCAGETTVRVNSSCGNCPHTLLYVGLLLRSGARRAKGRRNTVWLKVQETCTKSIGDNTCRK
jgi:hypothetical protein